MWLLTWFLSLLPKELIPHVTLELDGVFGSCWFVEETLVDLGLRLVGF
jgi:hypothetical protein